MILKNWPQRACKKHIEKGIIQMGVGSNLFNGWVLEGECHVTVNNEQCFELND